MDQILHMAASARGHQWHFLFLNPPLLSFRSVWGQGLHWRGHGDPATGDPGGRWGLPVWDQRFDGLGRPGGGQRHAQSSRYGWQNVTLVGGEWPGFFLLFLSINVSLIFLPPVPPHTPSCEIPSAAVTGSVVQLRCRDQQSIPPATYSWYKDNQLIRPPRHPNATYLINSHTGILVCVCVCVQIRNKDGECHLAVIMSSCGSCTLFWQQVAFQRLAQGHLSKH